MSVNSKEIKEVDIIVKEDKSYAKKFAKPVDRLASAYIKLPKNKPIIVKEGNENVLLTGIKYNHEKEKLRFVGVYLSSKEPCKIKASSFSDRSVEFLSEDQAKKDFDILDYAVMTLYEATHLSENLSPETRRVSRNVILDDIIIIEKSIYKELSFRADDETISVKVRKVMRQKYGEPPENDFYYKETYETKYSSEDDDDSYPGLIFPKSWLYGI